MARGGEDSVDRGVDVSTTVDLDRCGFLADHVVRGAVLVPTALQIETVVSALATRLGPGAGLALTDITVEDPVLVDRGSPVTVTVTGLLPSSGSPGRVALQGADGARHLGLYAAALAGSAPAPRLPRDPPPSHLPHGGGLIYPPMFHGPAFRVVGPVGRRGDHVVSVLADGLPAWDLRPGGGRLAQLVELLLQSCGVWELSETGRMMRPARIDRLEVSAPGGTATAGAWAEVWPDAADPSAFDGVVRDADGREQVRMRGYRPVELGPAQPAVAERLSRALHPPAG